MIEDKDKYGSLYQEHQPGVYEYFLHRTANQWHAEDLTSETFLKGFRAIERYKHTGIPIKTWFFTIAHNLLVNYYKGTLPLSLDTMLPPIGETIRDKNDLNDPVIQAEQHFMADRLRQAVETLSPDYQRVVNMYYFNELSHKVIAQDMGKSEGAIRVIKSRAVKKLRGILDGQDL